MKLAYYGFYNAQSPSGAGIHVYQIVKNLVDLGVDVFSWTDLGIANTQQLPKNPLLKLLELRRLNVLYVRLDHSATQGCAFARGWRRRILSRKLRHVWELNSLPESRAAYGVSPSDIRAMEDRLRQNAPFCDLLICVSDTMSRVAREDFGFKNVVTIPNASDPAIFHYDPSKWEKAQPLKVAWIGSAMEPWHNLALIQEAAQRAREKALNLEFHLAGKGTEDVPNTENLKTYGRVAYEKLPEWLADKHVGVICYDQSFARANSPLKMFDYMAAGLLVLSLQHPQVSQIVGSLQQLDPIIQDSDMLVSQLQKVCVDESISEQAKQLRLAIEDTFNWRSNTEATLEHIRGLC
ncbi:MAG: glycosyltransferase [Opitutales bacterium]